MLTIEKSLLNKVQSSLNMHKIFKNEGIIVAFSGGADSLALLSLLATMYPMHLIKAVYVNHKLRSEDELNKEIEMNRANCAHLKVPFILVDLLEGEVEALTKERQNGIEEAARYIRYIKLGEILSFSSYSFLATAHTKDDQNETLLMRMFQGSRHNFISPIKGQQKTLIRPMLDITRDEIEAYLEMKGLSWVEDSTNNTTIYLRNKIRHTLIPVLEEVFPAWDEGLSRLSEEFGELSVYVENRAREVAEKTITLGFSLDEVIIDLTHLSKEAPIIIRRVLYIAYDRLPFETPIRLPSKSVDDIIDSIDQKKSSTRLDIAESTLIFTKDTLIWKKGKIPLGVAYFSLVYSTYTYLFQSYYLFREEQVYTFRMDTTKVWIDDSVVMGKLVVRSYQEQDSIELKEGTKKVSSLFASWHIEPSVRWQIPLLVDDDGVIAILGRCFLGKDRVAKRAFLSPLADKLTTLYSVLIKKG